MFKQSSGPARIRINLARGTGSGSAFAKYKSNDKQLEIRISVKTLSLVKRIEHSLCKSRSAITINVRVAVVYIERYVMVLRLATSLRGARVLMLHASKPLSISAI